jgi:hypothetical protein
LNSIEQEVTNKMTGIERKSSIKISTSSANTDEKKENKRVQWKGTCRVRPFKMIGVSEQDLCWYHQKDYREFKKERKAAVMLAKAIGIEAIEGTDFASCRGIEYMLDKTLYQKKVKVQRRACVAVLTAQLKVFEAADEMNEEPNMFSSDIIPREYFKYSRQAHMEASQRALRQWISSQEQEEDTTAQDSSHPEDESFQKIDRMTHTTSSLAISPRKQSFAAWAAPIPGRAGGEEDWNTSRWRSHRRLKQQLSFGRTKPTLDTAPVMPPMA